MSPDGLWVVMRNSLSTKMLSVVSAGVGPATGRGEAGGGAGGAGRLHRRASRDAALQRDHLVRQKSVYTDIVLDLPPSIPLPDGEELPYGSSIRLQIRDPEQESEIYQKCIKPPPNRSVFESESPPPYRSNSAGVLGALPASSINSSSSSSSNSSSSSSSSSTTGGAGSGSTASDLSGGAPLVVRCHSMSSTSKRSEAKTDFLQRTVKILTGKKTGTAASGQSGSGGVGRPPSNV